MPWEKSSWPLLKNGGKAFKNCFKESEIVVLGEGINLMSITMFLFVVDRTSWLVSVKFI